MLILKLTYILKAGQSIDSVNLRFGSENSGQCVQVTYQAIFEPSPRQ